MPAIIQKIYLVHSGSEHLRSMRYLGSVNSCHRASKAGGVLFRLKPPARRQNAACCGFLIFDKMYVPSDSFGGISPERKASQAMQTLFTFVAVKVVLAQLEGSGRGALASMNPRSYQTLQQMLIDKPMKDGDEWLRCLLQRDEMLAMRILEVRRSYSVEDFEWDQLQRLTQEGVACSNTALLQQHAQHSFSKRMAAESAPGSERAADRKSDEDNASNA